MQQIPGTLVTRNYSDFRGVDFSNKEVILTRSPDSKNMWKDYKNNLGKCIETRPDIALVETYDNTIFGLFFYKVGNTEMQLVHCGTKLYKVVGENKTELFSNMKPARSQSFVFNNILYIKDGINYLKYDGLTINSVEVNAYVPTTSMARKPSGGGTIHEDVNMLSPYRKNTFVGDGKSTIYYLDAKGLDNESPVVKVNGIGLTPGGEFTYDLINGTVTFATAPAEPYTDGQANVEIKYKKTVSGHADRIKKCNILTVFDNRIFFSGNQDFPNAIWHSSLNDPSYCSDLDYYNEGLDLSPVKSMVAGNNALWVFKEPSQANTTVFYHNPIVDANYGKIYPSTHSSISTGCIATGINFNDDIVFFSDRGMEAIRGDVTTEQLLAHRSTLIDSKLLNETNYKNLILQEWEGYLLIIIDNKIYLADSRNMFINGNHSEYEFFYWELSENITCTQVKDGILYLGTEKGDERGIYTLTNNLDSREVKAYWTTPNDEFKYPQYQKTTNKRCCVIDMSGTQISVSVKTDNNEFELINTYDTTKNYVVARIKKKKWKSIQLKLSSTKPFKLYSSTLESYVGGYVKR